MMQFLGKCSRNWFWGFAIIIGLVFCPSLWAANIYVAPNGTGDGSTTLTPASLQDALNTANSTSGNHILFLQQGQYNASDVSGFKVTVANNTTEKSITLSGGWTTDYTGQYTDPETTRLDGVNTTRVLDLFADGGTAYINFHVENVTIQNGYVLGGSGAGIQADISSTNGGLLKLYVHLCLIRNNAARYNAGGGFGGGLYATGYVEVSNTTFESNSSGYHGGAIMFTYRPPYTDATISPKVDNCIFLNNFNPAGVCCPNGSAIGNSVNLTVTNSRFEGQTGSGSPIHSFSGSYLSVSNSFFYNNKIDYWGSAIQFWDSGGEIKNSVFMQNNTGWNNHDGYGAVTYNVNAESIAITNCTFLGNRSLTGGSGWGGALHSRGANLTIANSIFWDNGPMGLYSQNGNATISYSDVQGGLTSTGFTDGGNNITDDPGFAAGEYHLPAGSPCVDTGSNAAAAGITTDIDDESRVMHGTVDMGADEHFFPDPIAPTSPANASTFDACSYFAPPLFQWTLNEAFQKIEIRIFTPANPAKPAKVKVKDPTATQFQMTQSTWKKILKLPGLSGGELNWKIVGTNKGLPIVESDVLTMTIAAPEPAGKPDIDPLTHIATWGNSCGTKFKAYFSADSAFSKSKKLSFKYQGSTNSDDDFSVTLPDKTWASLEKLVEGLVPARLYFYVESWDIIKRYQKTDIAYFDLDI